MEADDDEVESGTGGKASPYVKPFLSAEIHYGIRRAGDNFMIGDSIISVDRGVI